MIETPGTDPARVVDPGSLTQVLVAGGVIADGKVVSIDSEPVGQDRAFFGSLTRLIVGYTPPGVGPESFILKVSGDRQPREARFYGDVDSNALPIPGCYHASIDGATGASILLLEDLTHLREVDFGDGLSTKDAGRAVSSLSGLHAQFWGDPALDDMTWGHSLQNLEFDRLWTLYPRAVNDLFPDLALPRSLLEVGNAIAADISAITSILDRGPTTLVHNDLQADNLLFGSDGSVTFIDWQFAGRGRGGIDLGYLLASSLLMEDRRREEGSLVERYHGGLVTEGCHGYTLDDCWSDYRLGALTKLAMTVTATVLVDNSTLHRKSWRKIDLERTTAFIEDHRPLTILGG